MPLHCHHHPCWCCCQCYRLRCAVQTLLITDSLFRTNDTARRKKYVQLVDEVEAGGWAPSLLLLLHISLCCAVGELQRCSLLGAMAGS